MKGWWYLGGVLAAAVVSAQDFNTRLDQGRAALAQGSYAQAVAEFEAARALEPEDEAANGLYATALLLSLSEEQELIDLAGAAGARNFNGSLVDPEFEVDQPNAPWTTQTLEGRTVAQSGAVTAASRRSSLLATVDGPGTLTFEWWMGISGPPVIYELYVNGAFEASLVSTGSWQEFSVALEGDGPFELEWRASFPEEFTGFFSPLASVALDEVRLIPADAGQAQAAQPLEVLQETTPEAYAQALGIALAWRSPALIPVVYTQLLLMEWLNPTFPTGLAWAFTRGVMLQRLLAVQSALARIQTTTFLLSLTLPGTDVYLDYADIVTVRAGVTMLIALVYLFNAYNLDVLLGDLPLIQGHLLFPQPNTYTFWPLLLQLYPQLFLLVHQQYIDLGIAQFLQAQLLWEQAVTLLQTRSSLVFLFALQQGDLAGMAVFSNLMATIVAAFQQPVPFVQGLTLDMRPFALGRDLRFLLPLIAWDPFSLFQFYPFIGRLAFPPIFAMPFSVLDATAGGVLPGVTQLRFNQLFAQDFISQLTFLYIHWVLPFVFYVQNWNYRSQFQGQLYQMPQLGTFALWPALFTGVEFQTFIRFFGYGWFSIIGHPRSLWLYAIESDPASMHLRYWTRWDLWPRVYDLEARRWLPTLPVRSPELISAE